ncbi:MAG: hypothetical protein LBC97_01395 [Bifidobacteriaceae bacterium]|nr:hypothetical protein [Bifidobacteriaceae bacterium]
MRPGQVEQEPIERHYRVHEFVRGQAAFAQAGGLVAKQAKSRKARAVPILEALDPALRRLAAGNAPEARLLASPRGGAMATAAARDAPGWEATVAAQGLQVLPAHAEPPKARVKEHGKQAHKCTS